MSRPWPTKRRAYVTTRPKLAPTNSWTRARPRHAAGEPAARPLVRARPRASRASHAVEDRALEARVGQLGRQANATATTALFRRGLVRCARTDGAALPHARACGQDARHWPAVGLFLGVAHEARGENAAGAKLGSQGPERHRRMTTTQARRGARRARPSRILCASSTSSSCVRTRRRAVRGGAAGLACGLATDELGAASLATAVTAASAKVSSASGSARRAGRRAEAIPMAATGEGLVAFTVVTGG